MFPNYLAAAMAGLALAPLGAVATPTPISAADMATQLANGALDLAVNYAPLWFFGEALNSPPCIPTWAFSGSPTQPDIFDTAHQTQPAPQCQYPNVGCGCRNPGVPLNNELPPFPVYYSVSQCNASEIRVVYNLFYQKDGARVSFIDTGHDYDWERAIVVHNFDPPSNTWSPNRLLLSAHSGYNHYDWADIQNTLSTAQIQAGDAINPVGQQDQDHPKVYASWSKHANFDNINTGWNDPISQSLDNAFRSQDWWYSVDPQYYVRSDSSTVAGQALGAANWGTGATSNPLRQFLGACAAT